MAALVAFLTGHRHIYLAAALTVVIKVIVLPRILRKVIERLNVSRELVMNINIPAGLLICGGLVVVAFFITQPIIPLGYLLTRDSLALALAIILIGLFTMIARKKAVTQMVGFLVMENGVFLGTTAAAYGMPLIVELGIFFDVLVAGLIVGIYTLALTWVLARAVAMVFPMRVDKESETNGLDISTHGERAYDLNS